MSLIPDSEIIVTYLICFLSGFEKSIQVIYKLIGVNTMDSARFPNTLT